MALTSTQQMQIATFLGWSAKTLIVGSTSYDQTVVNRLNTLNADAEALAIGYITDILDVKAKFVASRARMLVRKVGDIELNTGEHAALQREYKRLLRELAVLMDIPLLAKGGNNVSVQI